MTPGAPAKPCAGSIEPLRRLLLASVTLMLAFGGAKLALQRADPPAWARSQLFDGYVAIDGHAARAELFANLLRGTDDGELARDLRGPLHGNAVVVPAIVGALAVVVGSVPIAFVLFGIAMSGLAVYLVACLARWVTAAEPGIDAQLPGAARRAALVGGILFAGHCLTARVALQLHVDMACCVVTLAMALLVVDWLQHPSAARACGMAVLCSLAVFVKTSCLPLLAFPAIGVLVTRLSDQRPRPLIVPVAVAGLPVALGTAFAVVVNPSTAIGDIDHLASSWRLSIDQLTHFGVEMVLLLQVFPLLVWLHRPRSDPGRFVLLAAGCVLVATWSFKLPAVPRLYLPILALACAAATPALLLVAGRHLLRVLAAYLAVNQAVAAAGLIWGR